MNYKIAGALCFGTLMNSVSSLSAEEYTVELGSFEQLIKIEAVAMPSKHVALKLSPKVWKIYQIEDVVAHGLTVKKGDVLLSVDSEKLDKKIEELSAELIKEKILLEKADIEFAEFKIVTQQKLSEAELKYSRFTENLKYYKEVTKPAKISNLDYEVIQAQNYLAYSQEELDQLSKMYEEDGLTEETEEIIIQRAKNEIESEIKQLDSVKRNTKYQKEVQILRKDADWETNAVKEKRALEFTKKNLPLDLKVKELEMTRMKLDLENTQKEIDKLKADRALMDIISPVDGTVYYGEFKDGKWNHESAKKMLRVGGILSAENTFMSIVPQDSGFTFNAFFSEKQKIQLGDKREGNIRLKAKHWDSTSATIGSINDLPLPNQKWVVSFNPSQDLPEKVVVGSEAEVSVITYKAEEVLSIPMKAVKFHADGTFSVKIKMANEDPLEIKIKIGRSSGGKLEVLDGLEDGQVIIIPELNSKSK